MVDVSLKLMLPASRQRRLSRSGVVELRHLLPASCITDGRRFVDDALRQKHPSIAAEWMQNVHQMSTPAGEWLRELAATDAILNLVRAQIGDDALLLSTTLSVGSAPSRSHASEYAEPIPWHQEAQLGRCTLCIALDRAGHTVGLAVRPSVHERGKLSLRLVRTADELEHAARLALQGVHEIDPVHFPSQTRGLCLPRLRPGDGVLVHPYTPLALRTATAADGRRFRLIFLRYQPARGPCVPTTFLHPCTAELCGTDPTLSHRTMAPSAMPEEVDGHLLRAARVAEVHIVSGHHGGDSAVVWHAFVIDMDG